MAATPISVVILTLNEELNIASCLESCAWSDDVIVYDSFSSDLTCQIALQKGARVIQRRFDNYAAQRNTALNEVKYKHPWVLMVDADERVPDDLVVEMMRAVESAEPGTVLFRMRRKDYFFGRWLRRASGYPTWFGRLIRVGHVRVQREINEEFVPLGVAMHLKTHLNHYPMNKGIAYWYDRHNRYSSMEATFMVQSRGTEVPFRSFFSKDAMVRRRVWKQFAYQLPMRPAIVFFYWYVVRLGFLDGRAGLIFIQMRATYELQIDIKVMEQGRRQRGELV